MNSKMKKQVKKIKDKAYLEGQQEALNIVNMIPLIVLRDKYGFGKKRMTEYINYYLETIEAYNEDYLKLEDIVKVLKEEVGIDLEDFIQ